jgi:tetratricopeptide (TPR) repeat protein
MKQIFLFIAAFSITYCSNAQSLKVPAPSPAQYIKQDFGLGNIEIAYSRPGKKGRTIFGDLVPYGNLWRTGANSATTITFSDEVIIGDVKIPTGKYGLLTIPDQKEWTIIISKQTDVTSPSEHNASEDLVRVKAKAKNISETIENFTIQIDNISSTQCNVQLAWENTAVSFPVSTEIDSKVMKQIENTIIKDNRPYYSAAAYYIDNGKDLNQAVIWLDKSIENNPRAYWVYYRKAIALQKLGKKKEAIQVSLQSMQIAKEEKDDTYVRNNQKLQESLK